MHKVKRFKWEGYSLLQMWIDGQIWVVFRLQQCVVLYHMFMNSEVILGFNEHIICSKHSTSGEGSTIYFSMYDV